VYIEIGTKSYSQILLPPLPYVIIAAIIVTTIASAIILT
jgi:hypothetical protein